MSGRRASFLIGCALGVGVGLVLGVVVGYVVMGRLIRPGTKLLTSLPWADAANDISEETQILEKLRSGDSDGAAGILEQRLDEHLYLMASYETEVPAYLRPEATYRVLRRAAQYRDSHPRPPSSAPARSETETAIAKALEIGRQHVPAP